MNINKLSLLAYPAIAILSLAAASVAFAQGEAVDTGPVAQSLKTRAQVRAERDPAFERAFYGEDSGSFALAKQVAPRVAEPVYAAK